ncbi:MAG TPA: hypothetical protein ENI90_08075, partial [Methylothermaceae bacterium]|nr:hypothetical protein [Methylothermaceae bacterium]
MHRIAATVDWEGHPGLGGQLAPLLPAVEGHLVPAGHSAVLGGEHPACLYRDGELTLACDARIDNRPELEAALGPLPSEAGDGALILAAYQRWGSDCPGHLVGDFAFILWNAADHTLLAARDGMNMRTLNYLRTPRGVVLASEGTQLLRHPTVTPAFSEAGLAGWLSGWPDPDCSLFEGVEVLPPGHALLATSRGISIHKFWDID